MKILWVSREGGKWRGPVDLSIHEINEFLNIMMQRKDRYSRPCAFMFESGAVFDAELFHQNYFPWRNYPKNETNQVFNELTIEWCNNQLKYIYHESISN